MSLPPLSPIAFDVRKQDRERFVTALFAPEDRRDDLFVLYAFNAEVARIKSLVREPLAGAIRLQWWRDVVAQERPASEVDHHPIAAPLTQLIGAGRLSKDRLLAILDAREQQDLNNHPFETLSQMVSYADATAGNLAVAGLELLGINDDSTVNAGRGAAIAYGLMGLVRSIPVHASQGWVTLPADLYPAAQPITSKTDLSQPIQRIAEQTLSTLIIARKNRIHKAGLSVCLWGTLAEGHVGQIKKTGWNPFAASLSKPQTMPIKLTWKSIWGRF